MDLELRTQSLRAQQDPTLYPAFIASLLRSGKDQQVELEARTTGNIEATHLYFRILHFKHELDLNNLWMVPYAPGAIDTGLSSLYWPHSDPFFPPIPFDINAGTNIHTAVDLYTRFHDYTLGTIDGAWVVDVADLELADAVYNSLDLSLARNNTDWQVRHEAVITIRRDILHRTSILHIDHNGTYSLSLDPPLHPLADRYRSTYRYYNEYQPRGTKPRWPRRSVKQKLTFLPQGRVTAAAYVISLHVPTGRAFVLNGTYQLVSDYASTEMIMDAIKYNVQEDPGYRTGQRPAWAEGLPDNEFIAYWVSSS